MNRVTGRRAFTLVEILVVVVMLVVLFAIVTPYYLGRETDADGKARTPLAKADATVCMSNVRSVRQLIEAAKAGDEDGHPPATLAEVPGVTAEFRKCPVGGEPYVYDPQTGTIYCPHPSHERF